MVAAPSGMTSRHSSESVEHFTPVDVVARASEVLGYIDLDPATTEAANARIDASAIFTKEDNGYLKDWWGRVFLNPPGGWADELGQQVIKAKTVKGVVIPGCTTTGACGLPAGHTHKGVDSSQKLWWQKLATEWVRRNVETAIFVCFSVELLQASQVEQRGPLPLDFAICYPSRRLQYLRADGKPGTSPPHSSCIILVSDDAMLVGRFRGAFKGLGKVVVPMGTWPQRQGQQVATRVATSGGA
jgi:hypothetical protein